MDLLKALMILTTASAQYRGTLEEHKTIMQASDKIRAECVVPHEEKRKKEENKKEPKENKSEKDEKK